MSGTPFRYTFTKDERLYAQKRVDRLFSEGRSFISYPLRVVFLAREKEPDADPGVSVLVSVSKKHFKRAVKRNRVKRLVREAYRLNKQAFASVARDSNSSFDIAFLYLKNELPSYAEIEKAILKSINLLSEKCKITPEE